MKAFFKELFDYSHHYNQLLGEAFETNRDQVSEKSLSLFNHILSAHQVWNSRIVSDQGQVAPWDIRPLEEFTQIDRSNYENSIFILQKFELEQVIPYLTSKGQPFSNTVRDILFHIINHSTYHRAQIATEFRQSGLEPLVTDYIFYKR